MNRYTVLSYLPCSRSSGNGHSTFAGERESERKDGEDALSKRNERPGSSWSNAGCSRYNVVRNVMPLVYRRRLFCAHSNVLCFLPSSTAALLSLNPACKFLQLTFAPCNIAKLLKETRPKITSDRCCYRTPLLLPLY